MIDPIAQKFWDRVNKAGPQECWLWTGPLLFGGYGQTTAPGRPSIRAHRFAWELTYGPIPNGLHVCHSCDNPPCVNPAHLWLGSHRDNMLDMIAKGRAAGEFLANQSEGEWRTHCKRGHAFTPGNTERNPKGRFCRTCRYERQRARYAAARKRLP